MFSRVSVWSLWPDDELCLTVPNFTHGPAALLPRGRGPGGAREVRRSGQVRDGVFDARLFEGAQAQRATVTNAAGGLFFLVARPTQLERCAQLPPAPYDLALAQVDDRSGDFKLGFGARPRADDAVEGLVVFRAAIGIALAVLRHRANENLFRAEDFPPRHCDGEKMRVPERDVAKRDVLPSEVGLLDGDGRVRQAGAADLAKVLKAADQAVLGFVKIRQIGERAQLAPLSPLAVCNVQRRQAVIEMRDGSGHQTIHPAAREHYGQRLVLRPLSAVRRLLYSVHCSSFVTSSVIPAFRLLSFDF